MQSMSSNLIFYNIPENTGENCVAVVTQQEDGAPAPMEAPQQQQPIAQTPAPAWANEQMPIAQ